MKGRLAELLTDADGRHADEMALCAILGMATFLGLAIYSVVCKGQPFDPQAYGIGLGLAIGAASAGMGLKAKLDPARGEAAGPPTKGE